MKKIKIILSLFFLLSVATVRSQTVNWKNLTKENRHLININAGLEYALVYGIGYSYHLNTKLPLLLNMEYSFPSGNDIMDDLKTKIGGGIDLYQKNNFHFVANAHGIFRRYQNDFVRLLNFGCDVSIVTGYYKRKWYAAVETGFDKAIVTHFKHSKLYKSNFPQVVDGWYETSTGGNFYYGLQAGISSKQSEVYIKAGKAFEQDFKSKPLIPFFAQIGYNLKFK